MIGPVCCLVVLVIVLLLPWLGSNPLVQWAPWILGLVLLGIPHGAMDHKVNSPQRSLFGNILFFGSYTALALAVGVAWWLIPTVALVAFLVVAAFHFGQGDLYWYSVLREQDGLTPGILSDRWCRILLLGVRGIIPIALPALAFPQEFRDSAQALIGLLSNSPTTSWFNDQTRQLALLALSALVVFQVLASTSFTISAGKASGSRLALESLGTAILVAFFLVVPPVLAMGIYFNAWHATRHIGRLLLQDPQSSSLIRRGRGLSALVRFHLATLPITLLTASAPLSLLLLFGDRLGSVTHLGLVVVALASSLTFPHVVVVLNMDRMQHVWRLSGVRGVVSSGS